MALKGIDLRTWHEAVLERMGYEFFSAGYPSTKVLVLSYNEQDKPHPLHDLFNKTTSLIHTIFPVASTFCSSGVNTAALDCFIRDKEGQIMAARRIFAEIKKKLPKKMIKERLGAILPRHEEVLALRFTAFYRDDNRIMDMLADCDSLYLLKIPRNGDDDADTELDCAPVEVKPSAENTLEAGWAALERRVEAINGSMEDERSDLRSLIESKYASAIREIQEAKKAITELGKKLESRPRRAWSLAENSY